MKNKPAWQTLSEKHCKPTTCKKAIIWKHKQRCHLTANMRRGHLPSYPQTAVTYCEFYLKVHFDTAWLTAW